MATKIDKTHLTKMSVPKELRDRLKTIAKHQRMTMLGVIRLWVEKHEMLSKINVSK